MDLGKLPGYYYDKEKKKYFRIQANHVVPANAKYAKSNAKRENYEANERRLGRKRKRMLKCSTVKRSAVLNHPLLGSTLDQELMTRRKHRCSDDIVIAGLCDSAPSITSDPELSQVLFLEDQVLTSYPAWETGHSVLSMSSSDKFKNGGLADSYTLLAIKAFAGLRLTARKCNDLLRIMGWTPQGTVFITDVPENGILDNNSASGGAIYRFGGVHMQITMWAAAISKIGDCAVSLTSDIYLIRGERQEPYRSDLNVESRTLDWLDPNVLAYAPNGPRLKSVCLWDVRAGAGLHATASRFPCEHTVTGIVGMDNKLPSSNQILATTNHQIRVFDTRWNKEPIMTMPFSHGGPQSEVALNSTASLAAAWNRYQSIEIFSLSEGKRKAVLSQEGRGLSMSPILGLGWHEHENGRPMIYGCRDGNLVRWIWGGSDNDEG